MTNLDSYLTLGRSGLRVSPLCLGAMTFGAGFGCDEATSKKLLARYLEAGGNFIDTANGYSGGASEEIIGRYLNDNPAARDRMVLATKFAGNLFPGDPNGGGAGRKAVVQQLDNSLRRLGTDYIDLYWMHNYDQHTPIEETMSALDDQVRAGKIRYVGLSDTPAWGVTQAEMIARFRGWAPVAAIQIEYSLVQRTVEGELLPMAKEFGIGVTPWSPLGGGALTGKYRRDNTTPEDSSRSAMVSAGLSDKTFDIIDTLEEVAGRHGATMAATALAWVQAQSGVSSTIIGARTMEQLDSNLAALAVTLTDQDLAELDAVSAPSLNFPADFLRTVAAGWQQAGATINGVPSVPFG